MNEEVSSSLQDSIGSELERILPADLPGRARVVAGCARYGAALLVANQQLNLTAHRSPHDLAHKAFLDSLLPWTLFADTGSVLDLGTGGGFPGLPLALVYPEASFFLVDSVGKKARRVEELLRVLALPNVEVTAERGEAFLARQPVDVVVARAVARPLRLLEVLKRVHRQARVVRLYRGPRYREEMEEATEIAARLGRRAELRASYLLPGGDERHIIDYRF